MKIAAAQIACALGDVAANLRKIQEFSTRAKEGGAELVVFPELADTCAEIRHAADRVVEPANAHRETIRSSAPVEHVQRTRAAVDDHLTALGEARKRFVAHAQSTLKAHALLQVDGV